jgi:hypothetical protein
MQIRILSHTGFEAHPFVPIYRSKTVASALVNSRLDYANSVLCNTSSGNMSKLQRVQNSLARVVTYTKRAEHIHPVLHQLHWLPVNYRINYKVATLAYKYCQLEVQHTYFHQSATVLQPEIYDHPHNICSTCPPSGRR